MQKLPERRRVNQLVLVCSYQSLAFNVRCVTKGKLVYADRVAAGEPVCLAAVTDCLAAK